MKWCSESSWKYKSLGTQPSGKSKFKYKLISPRILKDEVKWSEVAQLCPALCDPMGCSLSGSSVHGIFQARVQEWTAISFSRGSSQPRNQIQVCCIAGRRFTVWATREARIMKWFCYSLLQWTMFCQNSPPWFIHVGWTCIAWLIASLSYTRLIIMMMWSLI